MLKTEMRNERTMNLHRMETMDMLSVFSDENFNAVRAVEKALPSIGAAIDEISSRMKNGGRLLFIGAGTSGRLGVLDASECPPTFGYHLNWLWELSRVEKNVCSAQARMPKTLQKTAEKMFLKKASVKRIA